MTFFLLCYAPPLVRLGHYAMMLSDVYLPRTPGLSLEQRGLYRKTKICTEVAHVTRDSNTTFKVKRSKVKVTRPRYSPRR